MAKVRRQDGLCPKYGVGRNGALVAPRAVRPTYWVTEGAVDEVFEIESLLLCTTFSSVAVVT